MKFYSAFSKSVLALCCALWIGKAQAQTPPSIAVTGTAPAAVKVGEQLDISLSAVVNNAPTTNQECTIDGPVWQWTPNGTGASVSPADASSTTLSVTFTAPGTYTIGAAVNARFTSSCSTQPINVSGGKSFTIKAVSKTWTVHTPVGQTVDSEGQAITDGRITSPQDQTQNPPVPAQVFVPVGKEITASVENATDNDKWTMDLNGDDSIDPDPGNGETGVEEDTVKYSWSGGGTFGNATSSSTTWKSDVTGTFTLTCTIDDEWESDAASVSAPETGNRNDQSVARSVQVVVFSAELFISRKGTGLYQTFANVAAGGLGGAIHKGDIMIKATPAMSGIPIDAPTLQGHEGVNNQNATVAMDSAVTNGEGKIYGTFTSSNKTKEVKLTLNTGQSGSSPTASFDQRWNDDGVPWNYKPFFSYDQALSVAFEPRFKDADVAQTLVPLGGHSLSFRLVGATVYQWDEDEGTYVPEYYEAEDGSSVLSAELSGDTLAEFDTPQPKTDSPNGIYSSNLTVYWNWDEIVDDIQFRVIDEDTYEAN